MGACAILTEANRARKSCGAYCILEELCLQTEGDKWGFFNKVVVPCKRTSQASSLNLAKIDIVDGPTFGNMMTKTMLSPGVVYVH